MTLMLVCVTAVVVAGEPVESENLLLAELLEKGVAMSDGSSVRLPPPTLPDGLDAAGQRAALEQVGGARHPVEELLRKSIVAPFVLSIRSLQTPAGESPARAVDLWFVAHGDWDTLGSKEFVERLFERGDRSDPDGRVSKSGWLDEAALAKRKIDLRPQPDQEERYSYGTGVLFDRVELSTALRVLVTRRTESFLAVARIDPRFNGDPEYPNQWRSIARDLDNPQNVAFGPPQLYTSAGCYGKMTRLAQPAGAMFIEYHLVFEEPHGWFKGANLLRSKLPLVVQDEVRTFRRRLQSAAGTR